MANISIGGRISLLQRVASLDLRYGPYSSIADAYDNMGPSGDDVITAGLPFGVTEDDGSVSIYIWTKGEDATQTDCRKLDKEHIVLFNGFIDISVPIKQQSYNDVATKDNIVFLNDRKQFAYRDGLNFYINWKNRYVWSNENLIPYDDVIYIDINDNKAYYYNGTTLTLLASETFVSSINNQAPDENGNVNLTKEHIGLDKVDNTSDTEKVVKGANEDGSGNNIATTYETKSDATTKNTALQNAISALQTSVGNLTGLDSTNFGGFSIQSTEADAISNIATIYTADGYTNELLWYMAGTSLSSVKAYRYNGSGTPTLISNDSYDCVDFSGLIANVATLSSNLTALGPKISKIDVEATQDNEEKIIIGEAINDPTIKISDKSTEFFGAVKINGSSPIMSVKTINGNPITGSGDIEIDGVENYDISKGHFGDDTEEILIGETANDPTIKIKDKETNFFGSIKVNGSAIGSEKDGAVTISDSDCITVLGSSFGETNAFPSNKHWSGILSLFSDYQFQNNSAGGSNKVTNLYFLRSGSWVARGNYVMVSNDENIGSMTIEQVTKALDNICRAIIGMGKTPIVCTSYHKTAIQSAAFKDYAYRHNLMFWDAAAYCSSLYSGINGTFDDGAHLRRRNIVMVADAYFNHHHLMERPFKSMKVFRVRESFNGSLDDLVFTTNEERARNFKEVTISSVSNQDEYKKLIDGTALSFSRYALVSCVLPANAKDLTRLVFSLTTSANVAVYARNTMVAPYPNPSTTMMRFSVSETITIPSQNDVYSVGGVNYTVGYVKEGENNYFCTIYCTPSTMPSSQSGTLSKVSGTGPSSIPYVMAETASYDVTEFLDDNCGHWVEIQGSDNVFEIEDIDNYVDIDKVHLLVAYNGTFTAKDFSVAYSALALKDRTFNRDFVWEQNSYYGTTEIIQEPNFGAIGTQTSWWKDGSDNAITSVGNVGNKFPFGLSSEIVVTNVLSMNVTIPSTSLENEGQLVLEVCCRYFPQAPSPYTQANDTNVNNDSYDYNTLFVKVGDMVFEKEIGLMWKFARISIPWFYHSQSPSSLGISLYSNNKGIEICNISLKYMTL